MIAVIAVLVTATIGLWSAAAVRGPSRRAWAPAPAGSADSVGPGRADPAGDAGASAGSGDRAWVSRQWARWDASWSGMVSAVGAPRLAPVAPIVAAAATVAVFALVAAVSGSVAFALFAAATPAALTWMALSGRVRRRQLLLDRQLGGFITSLAMFVESGEQPIRALYAAARVQPAPLRALLRTLTDAIDNNVPPADALRTLQASTDSPVLGELCANLRIALRSGQDLAGQLSMLADMHRLRAEARLEADRELLAPRSIAVVVIAMAPLTYLAIWLFMPEWHAMWSASWLGVALSFVGFALNGVGALLIVRALRSVTGLR